MISVTAPTDGNYRRIIFGIVNRLGERVEKTVGGSIVRRKIHHNLRSRRRRARHLDIKSDFGVRAIGSGWRVRTAVDGDWNHGWRGKAETREIRSQIRRLIAPTQLDNPDG